MKTPTAITTEHVVMACPVCELNIVATVTARIELGSGTYDPTTNAIDVPVATTPLAFHVNHACAGRPEVEEMGG